MEEGLADPPGSHADTLVLSTGYEPMYRVDWRAAMTMWVSGRVELLEAYTERPVRTASRPYARPAVVRYVSGVTLYRGSVKLTRDHLYIRDLGGCQYCGADVARPDATYDHVLPRAAGGRTRWDNMVLACRPCNQFKADRTPRQAGMALRRPPREPRAIPMARAVIAFGERVPASWTPYLRVG